MDSSEARHWCHVKIVEAARKFEEGIYPSDVKLFKRLELKNVWEAAKEIETRQSSQKTLRNTRRLETLLESIKIFVRLLETSSSNFPGLCYIWAPINVMMLIFENYTIGYEKLINAYAEVAQNLPSFGRLDRASQDQPEFQNILADIYADILEFHLEIYKIGRRRKWTRVFDTCWIDFRRRFEVILTNLARNRDLVDRGALSLEILESQNLRRKMLEEAEKAERERQNNHFREVFAWLDLAGRDREQEDLLSNYQTTRHEGTCQWFMAHPNVQTWFDEEDPCKVLWLKGKPGSGKSTLAAYLTEEAPMSPKSFLACCLCSELLRKCGSDIPSVILRLICAQLLRSNLDLLSFVYDIYVKTYATPSITRLRHLLRVLLSFNTVTFLVIDGLDEYAESEQTAIIKELIHLLKPIPETVEDTEHSLPKSQVKLMVCSRDTQFIKQKLTSPLTIDLSREADKVSKYISIFAKAKLDLRGRFKKDIEDEIGDCIVAKANGMFLWVKMVLEIVQVQQSQADLRKAIDRLPKGLNGVYFTILDRLKSYHDEHESQMAARLLGLLAFALRPLKCREVCDAIVFQTDDGVLNEETKLSKGILDICKPLIEETSTGSVSIVHFTARTYILSGPSGPYLSTSQVQSEIALSCTRYLKTSKIFLTEENYFEAVLQVVKGFHDFFPYAHEFWTEHLSSAAKCEESSPDGLKKIKTAISEMWPAFQRNHPGGDIHEATEQNHSVLTSEVFDLSRVEDVGSDNHHIRFFKPLDDYVLFKLDRSAIRSKACKRLDVNDDPTKLTEAYLRYRFIVESLLDGSIPIKPSALVSQEDLDNFRSYNSSGAYCCNWTGCIRAWMGFATAEERNAHETSHKREYQCMDPSCLVICPSHRALKRHEQEYHIKANNLILKKRSNCEVPEENAALAESTDIMDEDAFQPDYHNHWYRPPNLDAIRQNASKSAAASSKTELIKILNNMTPTLIKELHEKAIEPLAYHFRKIAIKEFRSIQNEKPDKRGNVRRQGVLIKNSILQGRLQAEGEAYIDASVTALTDLILQRPERGPDDSWEDDVSHLWRTKTL